VIAIDGRRVDEAALRERLRNRKPGDVIELLVSRREQISTLTVTLAEPSPEALEFVPTADASAEARALGEAWLGPGASAVWSSK
jgi:predicted metalloprotease with PDZ domain